MASGTEDQPNMEQEEACWEFCRGQGESSAQGQITLPSQHHLHGRAHKGRAQEIIPQGCSPLPLAPEPISWAVPSFPRPFPTLSLSLPPIFYPLFSKLSPICGRRMCPICVESRSPTLSSPDSPFYTSSVMGNRELSPVPSTHSIPSHPGRRGPCSGLAGWEEA